MLLGVRECIWSLDLLAIGSIFGSCEAGFARRVWLRAWGARNVFRCIDGFFLLCEVGVYSVGRLGLVLEKNVGHGGQMEGQLRSIVCIYVCTVMEERSYLIALISVYGLGPPGSQQLNIRGLA